MAERIGWQGVAWCTLLALQAWSLHRIEALDARLDALQATRVPVREDIRPFDAAMAAAEADAIARIETRLAAAPPPHDARDGDARAAVPPAAPATPPAIADARLATLLPAGASLSDAQLAALQQRIDQLPAGERQAVGLALARAINGGRLRVVP